MQLSGFPGTSLPPLAEPPLPSPALAPPEGGTKRWSEIDDLEGLAACEPVHVVLHFNLRAVQIVCRERLSRDGIAARPIRAVKDIAINLAGRHRSITYKTCRSLPDSAGRAILRLSGHVERAAAGGRHRSR